MIATSFAVKARIRTAARLREIVELPPSEPERSVPSRQASNEARLGLLPEQHRPQLREPVATRAHRRGAARPAAAGATPRPATGRAARSPRRASSSSGGSMATPMVARVAVEDHAAVRRHAPVHVRLAQARPATRAEAGSAAAARYGSCGRR